MDVLNTLQPALSTAAAGWQSVNALQEALRSREAFLAQLIECSQDCIMVLDLDGRLLSMNAEAMRMFEALDFALQGSAWPESWPVELRETVRNAVRTASHGGAASFVGTCATRAGASKWWDVTVNGVPRREGRPERLLAVLRDITDRRRTETLLRAVTEGTASVTGRAFYASLVQHLAASLQVRFVYVAEHQPPNLARVRAFWRDGRLSDTFEYDLEQPCTDVVGGQTRCCSERVQWRFPANRLLRELGAESYLGVPAMSSAGRIVGHLVVLDDKPIEHDPLWMSVLHTFATRAAAELERERVEASLRDALSEVEALKNRLEAENVYLQEEIQTEHRFHEIVGNSPALLDALRQVELVAPTDTTVLVAGETGCGKELFARAVHSRSRRSSRPLVKVNCGAIAPGLVESELFGHVKGAFTGAVEKRIGRFELAHGGTIFLDEISELPLDAQVKLLRVLQEHEFEPVGSSRTIRVDVRVIAATNRDLNRAVADGRFRDDLLYRLNVFPIWVPPLRERQSDISLLVGFFVAALARRLGRPVKGFSARSMDRLLKYGWPGNVRELQNVVERAAILSRGSTLELDGTLQTGSPAGGDSAVPLRAPASSGGLETLEAVERAHIISALSATGGVVGGAKGAAAVLGLHPNTLRSRMKRLGVLPRGRS